MEHLLEYVSQALLLIGMFFIVTGAVGTLRFPDFYSRTHACGMTDSIGLPLVLLGLLLHLPLGLVSLKILLLIGFAMITSATASHALAKAAVVSGLKPATGATGKEEKPDE